MEIITIRAGRQHVMVSALGKIVLHTTPPILKPEAALTWFLLDRPLDERPDWCCVYCGTPR